MAFTGQLGIVDSVLGSTFVLAFGAAASGANVSAASSINVTQSSDKTIPIRSLGAETDIDIDGTWTQAATNNVIEADATSAMALAQDAAVIGPLEAQDANSPIAITDQAAVTFDVFGRAATSDLDIEGSNPAGGLADTNIRNLFAETPDAQSDDPAIIGLGFTDNWEVIPRLADTFDLDVSSTIVLVSVAPPPGGSRRYFADSTVSLLDFADIQIKTRAPVNTLELTQEATFFKVYGAFNQLVMTTVADEGFVTLQAASIIDLQHIARPNPRERDSESTIALTQLAESSIKSLDAENTIVPDQDINVLRPFRVDAENKISGITDDIFVPPFGPIIPGTPFGMSQEATFVANPVRNPTTLINIADSAQAVHIHFDAVDLNADSNVGLTQLANLSTPTDAETIIDSLQVSAVATLNSEPAFTLLRMGDQAFATVTRDNTPATSTLTLKHAVGFSLVRDTTDCDYTPFVSESGAATIPPRPVLPEARVPELPGVRFRLAYPPLDAGATVDFLDMRAPQFGNKERIDATRINRESQGGTLVIFADPIWPEVHALEMTFASLKQSQARGLLTFMERWLGQEIGIYDYEGRVWKGVITNPDEAVTHDGRENFAASLQIEAKRVHQLNRVALSNLGVTDTAGETVNESLATSAISVTDDADFVLEPVAIGNSPIAISDSSDYTKVPVATGFNAIAMSAFATRNSFFYESASSTISLGDLAAELDFDDFGNLIHNWDAENTSGVSDGNPVSTWDDLGSSPVTLHATVSQEPTARDNVLNSRRVIEFRHSVAVERMLTLTNAPLWNLTNKTGTIFIVSIVREVLAGGNEAILGNNTDKILLGGTTSTQRPVALLSGEGTVALETPQIVLGNGTTQLLMLKRDGNNLYFRRNKVDEDGTTFSTNPAPGDEPLYFGGFSGAGNSVDIDMAQVLIYDDILSDADVLTIEGLLAVKWGV